MSNSPRSSSNISLTAATVAALAIGAVFIGGMIVMGVLMVGHMGGSASPQAPVVAAEAEVTVDIRDFDYFPRNLTVNAGTQVTWVNRDTAPHTATVRGGWDTGTLGQDEGGTISFDTPGTYEYICTIHPYMKATLTVRSTPTP